MTVFNGKLYAGIAYTSGVGIWEYSSGTTWTQVNLDGFEDQYNLRAYSMTEYNGYLYIGTETSITGAEVWEYDGLNWSQINNDGFLDSNNFAAKSMAVFDGKLYVGTINSSAGAEIWEYDGSTWTQRNTDGFGDANNSAAKSMAVFDGKLYVGTDNETTGAEILRYVGGATWVQVNADGFGDPNNLYANSMALASLYVGTYNRSTGAEIWKYESAAAATQYTLTMQVTGSGSTNPAVGTHDYDDRTEVSITASPDSGWQFDSWSDNVADPFSASTTVTMDSNKSVTATFIEETPTQYTLTTATVGSGSVALSPSGGIYNEGTVVTLSATADSGWVFSSWSGDLTGSTNPETITMNAGKTVTATFTEVTPTQYTLTVTTVGNGSVTLNPAGGTYDEGTVVTLTATADSGWAFSSWSGDLTGSTNSETITMDADKTVTATFIKVYTLAVTTVGQGSVTLNPAGGTYDEGTVVSLTAEADSGCKFMGWSGDLTGSTNPETITMNDGKNVKATFNCPPDTPTALSPADEAIFAEGPVTIKSSTFSDPDTDDKHTESHWLVRRADSVYYRSDYDTSFNTIDTTLAPPGEPSQHEVSGLSSGMKYVWKVGYTDSGSGETSWSEEYSFKIGTSEADSSVEIYSGTEEKDFKMVSFVQWPDDPSCTGVFGVTYDTNNFRIGTYDPTTGGYIECGSGLKIKPGKAYWFLARDGLPITVNGIPVSLIDDIDVGLLYNESDEKGWNMIGCPNAMNYYWGNVQVLDGTTVVGTLDSLAADENYQYIDIRIWKWENGAYVSYEPSDFFLMEKYEGYWVKAKKANVFLRFRVTAQTASISNPPTYFARLLSNGKRWMKRWVFTTHVAIADSDDSPPRPMGDFSTVSPESVGGCFIATAAYGSGMERHVKILRDFRDTYLLNSTIGQMFVKAYYRYSPPVADFIAKHKAVKVGVRMGLLPLVAFCYSALHFGLAVTVYGLLLIFMPFIFLVLLYKRRRV